MIRRAFTLLELLIVLAIISVLIAVILPAMAKSRQISRSAVCQANIHSLCIAMQMYADNNDGRMPTVGLSHGGSVVEQNAWINTAAIEIGADKVTRCPDDRSPYWNKLLPGTDQRRRLSYATNYYATGAIEGREEFNNYTRITRPSTTIFWVELAEEGGFAVADHVHPETWFANPLTLASREMQLRRHMNRANYGFVDGHVESLPFEETYSLNVAQSAFPNIVWNHNKYDPRVAW